MNDIAISIIIPTYNRSATLAVTLSSIYRQKNLAGCEIIVVDNGSTDDTADVCKNFTGENKPALKYLYDAKPGLLTGRHLGASVANGKIICFLDDDVELCSLWLEGVKDAFKDDKVQLATGPCLPKFETYPPAWLSYFWKKVPGGKACTWLSLIDLGDNMITINPVYVWGLNFCIRKTALTALGGFHPDCIPPRLQVFQGDGETGLTLKAGLEGYKAVYQPKIMLYHIISAERLTLKYFEQRAFYQGICESFTFLKKTYSANSGANISTITAGMLKMKLQEFKKRLPEQTRFAPKEVADIRNALFKKEREGYEYHQQAFNNDNRVRQWVLQPDYWNYKLPV